VAKPLDREVTQGRLTIHSERGEKISSLSGKKLHSRRKKKRKKVAQPLPPIFDLCQRSKSREATQGGKRRTSKLGTCDILFLGKGKAGREEWDLQGASRGRIV